jgi:hypothetical protein
MEEKQVLESFVARIWLERGSNGDPLWRGRIKHVQGQEEAYFQDLGEISEFLKRVTGVPGLGSAEQRGEDDASKVPRCGDK